MKTFLQVFSSPGLFMLAAIWIYSFIYSSRHNVGWPWGFGILLAGVLVSGQGITFQINDVVYFWISASFILTLLGLLWNIVGIRNQVYVKGIRKTLSLVGIGLVFGILAIPLFAADPGVEYFQGDAQFTPFAVVIGYVQISIAEEFLFRGYLLSYLRKYGVNLRFAVIFQSLIFTAFHIQRYSDNWIMLFVIFLFGILAAYLTWKSDNLIPASLMHVVVNLYTIAWILSLGVSH